MECINGGFKSLATLKHVSQESFDRNAANCFLKEEPFDELTANGSESWECQQKSTESDGSAGVCVTDVVTQHYLGLVLQRFHLNWFF